MTGTIGFHLNEELLLAVVRAERDHEHIRDLLARPDFDWDSFWQLAGEQDVRPLVASVLSDRSIRDAAPDDAHAVIRSARLQMTISNMANQTELETVVARLREHGIPAVPLKGTQLTLRLFGALDARRCGDIDILVPEADWEATHRALLAIGYASVENVRPGIERHTFHGAPLMRFVNGRPFQVEIHRQLTDPRFLSIDHGALWQRIGQQHSCHGDLMELPTDELLVFLAVHAPKHSTGTLRLLADIDHLIAREGDRVNWDRVLVLARTWHADAILYFVLTLSMALLSTPVPTSVLRDIRPPAWKRGVVPFLVGPQTVLRPPTPLHLRGRRFRIAYCLMLRRGGEIRSYWHYIMMPPAASTDGARPTVTQRVSRPLDGLVWTALAVGSAFRDRYRPRVSTQS